MGKNPKFWIRVRFGFLHIFKIIFGFCSVLGKTWVLILFVLLGSGAFPSLLESKTLWTAKTSRFHDPACQLCVQKCSKDSSCRFESFAKLEVEQMESDPYIAANKTSNDNAERQCWYMPSLYGSSAGQHHMNRTGYVVSNNSM